MPSTPGKIVAPVVGVLTSAADQYVAETLEHELPGFWEFLKERYPKFINFGEANGPPIGFIHAFEVYEAMAETIPVYVRALQERRAG